jgi:hypothetical protein
MPSNRYFLLALCALPAAAATCDSLASLALPNTKITVESRPAGTFTPPGGRPIANLPAFCRVSGSIRPTADSDIRFEVWLPAAEWNGKFQGIGNGGFAGTVGWGALAAAVRRGYATASTDTGHEAGEGINAAWALGHPEKIADFGYRAIHETADRAKSIVRVFYGDAPKRSYFSSCSNGGRQALMEAQRYPADYDGIIAGAPANYWTHLFSTGIWAIQALMADPASYVPAAKIPAIDAAALAACDARDGLTDGLIDDPPQCHFDPSVLLCKGAESDACLTAPQVTALKKIYSGPRDSKGKLIHPGLEPGGEAGRGGWADWISGEAPGKGSSYGFTTQFFKNMVFHDADWDYHTFQIERDIKVADDKLARALNATDPDLKKFQDRGGKLILYHGWSDAAIAPQNAIDYYRSVIAKMGQKQADSFSRLYMVPGMQHCGGGPGPSSFGQGGVATGDPKHNVADVLESWVESNTAPAEIIATKYKPNTQPQVAERTRPLCPYPQVAKYSGSGSIDDAANFSCTAPGK